MTIIMRKDYTEGVLALKAGMRLDVTKELGQQLVSGGYASEIKPMMLDRDAFNELMKATHVQSVIRDEEEE